MSTRAQLSESTQPTNDNNNDNANAEEEEEEEGSSLSKLEEELFKIADKVEEYRSTLPSHLNSSLSSLLVSLRPDIHDVSPHLILGAESSSDKSNRELAISDDEKFAKDVELLKDKISSNTASMPKVLKRMNDCISRIDRLCSSTETTYPAFKRKKS